MRFTKPMPVAVAMITLAVLTMTSVAPQAEARTASSFKSAASSLKNSAGKKVKKPSRKEILQSQQYKKKSSAAKSSSSSEWDAKEYKTLDSERNRMMSILGSMQEVNLQFLFSEFGSDSKSVKRMEEIRNTYANSLATVTLLTESARQNPLKDHQKAEAQRNIDLAKDLAEEFNEILDRLVEVLKN